MNYIDVSGLTLPVSNPESVGELIFLGYANSPKFTKMHNLFTDIRTDRRIIFIDAQGLALGTGVECDTPVTGNDFVRATEKTWEPVNIGIQAKQCYQTLLKTGLYFLTNNRTFSPYNLAESPEFVKFLYSVMTQKFWEQENWREYWLQDTSYIAADFTTPIPSSVGALSYIGFYNKFDGFWKQITTIGTDCSFLAPDVTTANSQANYSLQVSTLSATAGIDALRALKNASDTRLIGSENCYFALTRELYDNFIDYLANTGSHPGVMPLTTTAWNFLQQDASRAWTYYGKPVICLDSLSFVLNRDFRIAPTVGVYDPTIPTGYRVKDLHRACLVNVDNMGVCVDGKAILNDIRIKYDSHLDKIDIVGSYLTDAKVLVDYMAAFVI